MTIYRMLQVAVSVGCFLAVGCGGESADGRGDDADESETGTVQSAASWAGPLYRVLATRVYNGSTQFDIRTTNDVAYGPCSAGVFPGLVCTSPVYLGSTPTYGTGKHAVYTCVVQGGAGQNWVENGVDSRDTWCGVGQANVLWKGNRYYWDNSAAGRKAMYSCLFGGGEIATYATSCPSGTTVREFLGYIDP